MRLALVGWCESPHKLHADGIRPICPPEFSVLNRFGGVTVAIESVEACDRSRDLGIPIGVGASLARGETSPTLSVPGGTTDEQHLSQP
jgi:hypothetical protein